MSLKPPPKMLSRLRDEEGRAYHDVTMQKRHKAAMLIARMKELVRIEKLRGGMAEPHFGPDTRATITTVNARVDMHTTPPTLRLFALDAFE